MPVSVPSVVVIFMTMNLIFVMTSNHTFFDMSFSDDLLLDCLNSLDDNVNDFSGWNDLVLDYSVWSGCHLVDCVWVLADDLGWNIFSLLDFLNVDHRL